MTSYTIRPDGEGLAIEISGVADRREQLLTAFGECAAGQCSCPTDEYQKVEAMEVVPADDTVDPDRQIGNVDFEGGRPRLFSEGNPVTARWAKHRSMRLALSAGAQPKVPLE